MAVSVAQQRRADRMAGEQDRLVAAGIASSRSIISKARGAIIREWRNGGDLTAPLAALRPKLAEIVNTGMVASHLQGTMRAAIATKRVRGVALASAVDDFAAKLAGQLDWNGSGLDSLASRYSDAARSAADEAVDAAIRLIAKQARVLAVQGVSTSTGVAELRAALDSAGLSLDRPSLVETVYRTEFQSTYQAARWQANEAPEIQSILWGYEYVTVGDDRVRPSHAALEGMRLEKADPRWERFWPPNGFNCFLPGTIVAGEFVAGLKARYSGPAVEIETSGGSRLSVTANHPILTDKGWRKAYQLSEGEYCIGTGGNVNGLTLLNVNDEEGPSRIEDVFEALMPKGVGSSVVLPCSDLDLYGDGGFIDGNVDVVSPALSLLGTADAAMPESIGNLWLPSSDASNTNGIGACAFDTFLETTNPTLRRLPRRGKLTRDRFGILFDRPPLQPFGCGLVANRNANIKQGVVDHGAGNLVTLVQSVDGLAIGVEGSQFFDGEAAGGLPERGTATVLAEEVDNRSNVNPVLAGDPGASLASGVHAQDGLTVARQSIRCGLAANWNALASEEAKHGLSADPQLIGDLHRASAGLVSRDKIIRIRRFEYTGHVYDLQSTTGWILANGIGSANCRCQTIEIFHDERIARVIEPPDPKEVDGVMVIPGPDEGFGVNVGLIRR